MFNSYRKEQYRIYTNARKYFCDNPQVLIALEEFFATYLAKLIKDNWLVMKKDYDEASFLYPFWQNYPPDDRGRMPKGDQYPWIEVGEHAVGEKISRLIGPDFSIRDVGLPAGADQRFVLTSDKIKKLSGGCTDSVFLHLDIKSVGPRDDAPHAVMSHNQISGDGRWEKEAEGIKNSITAATGTRTTHPFHCSIPPIYVLSEGTIAPVISMIVKPVYSMPALSGKKGGTGQPLAKIVLASIPNGLLMFEKPNYIKQYPGLLFPGKDDKGKNPLKVRARVSFKLLSGIASWRVLQIN